MYEVIKINDNSWRIEDDIVRVFLFVGKKKALLIDSGLGSGNLRETIEEITDLPIVLVNTHGDDDHIGSNNQFDEIFLHPSEYAFYAKHTVIDEKIKPIWEGDVIDIGGRIFEIILIPGHTPGSIALLEKKERILIAGDSVSTTPIFIFGEDRNIYSYIGSMKKLLMMEGAFDKVYSSHGAYETPKEMIEKLQKGAEEVLKGTLIGMDPPMDIPAKMFEHNGALFFY